MKVASLGWLLVLVGLPARADDNVKPVAAELYLSWRAPTALSGTVTYTIECDGVCRDIDMHLARSVQLRGASIDGEAAGWGRDDDQLRLRPRRGYPAGRHRLELQFSTRASLGYDHGAFVRRSPRRLYTHFEPQGARRLFPAFDTPRWRFPWTITLEAGKDDTLLSNAALASTRVEGRRQVASFAPTSALPTYLLSLVAGKFAGVEHRVAGERQVPLRVLSGGVGGHGAFADLAVSAVKDVEAWAGEPLPLEKLDLVLVDGLRSWGAMETPGLIPVGAPWASWHDQDGEGVAKNILDHELAHQWFGVRVVPWDWADVWVNEGVAYWYAARRSMGGDWCGSQREAFLVRESPMSWLPLPREPVDARFNAVPMWATGGVFCAIDDWWTVATGNPGALDDALLAYARAHTGGHVRTAELLRELGSAQPSLPTDEAFGPLLFDTATPVLEMHPGCDGAPSMHLRLSLGQRPYERPLPVLLQPLGHPARAVVVTGGEAVIPWPSCDAPAIGDAGGGGAYRVAYTAEQLDALTAPENWRQLSDMQVVALGHDAAWSVRQGRLESAERLRVRINNDLRNRRVSELREVLKRAKPPGKR